MKTMKLMATVVVILTICVSAAWSATFEVTGTHTGNDWTYVFKNNSANLSVFTWDLYWYNPIGNPPDQQVANGNFYDGLKGDGTIDKTSPDYGYQAADSYPKPQWDVDYSYINHPGFTSTDNNGAPLSPIAPGGQLTFKVHYKGSTAPTLFTAMYVARQSVQGSLLGDCSAVSPVFPSRGASWFC